MALYRSPLTVTLWPSSFLKKYGPMIPPAHKAHQTKWKLKLSRATAHEGPGLLRLSQYTWSFGAEVHKHMSRSGGQSEAKPPVFKSPSKLGTHLSTYCSRDERLSRPCPARE
ncbi:uncharacterized protein TNCV_239471 [Trichonephila clavipes]|nr:uncharacterized protein TNCV_239471 [Trichonephila clavipes]